MSKACQDRTTEILVKLGSSFTSEDSRKSGCAGGAKGGYTVEAR